MIIPREHQAEFMRFHKTSKQMGSLAWHGMGLGKTLSSLWLARDHLGALRSLGVTTPKLMVIVPKSAVPTWKVECHKNVPSIYRDMIIYPYSQLHNAVKALKYSDVRMIVFDESHYLKSPETNRIDTLAEFLREMGRINGKFEHGRIVCATGTPMPNSAAELYTSWALCCAPNLSEAADRLQDKTRFNNWKMSFAKRKEISYSKGWGAKKHIKKGAKYEGVDNEDMLQQLLAPFVHFRRVEDCIDLPDKQIIPIDLGLPDDRLLADANIEEPEAYMALLERLARAKTPYLMDWVEDFLSTKDKQLVVFSMYRFPIEELREKYAKDVRLITGAESNADRAQNLTDFQEGKFRILAMTFKAGSESLNLQNAHYSLYHGYPWHDDMLQQAMARTFRSGQKEKTMHYFLTSGLNDQKILDIILGKAAATNKVKSLLLSTSLSQKPIMTVDSLL